MTEEERSRQLADGSMTVELNQGALADARSNGAMMTSARTMGLAAAALTLLATAAPAAESSRVAAGRLLAQRHCGGCHATAGGRSPFADAPPFRQLYRRYPPGGLERILKEGMLAPDQPSDEGSRPRHPRMPMVTLGMDETAELRAYLTSLEPPAHRRGGGR
jgi:mono/diheme cytochrome c family protein